jgi:hypothetical protein
MSSLPYLGQVPPGPSPPALQRPNSLAQPALLSSNSRCCQRLLPAPAPAPASTQQPVAPTHAAAAAPRSHSLTATCTHHRLEAGPPSAQIIFVQPVQAISSLSHRFLPRFCPHLESTSSRTQQQAGSGTLTDARDKTGTRLPKQQRGYPPPPPCLHCLSTATSPSFAIPPPNSSSSTC